MQLDKKNKNMRWKDNAVALDFLQIDEYKAFCDLGHHTKAHPPASYKKICVYLVFDIKHDGTHALLSWHNNTANFPNDNVTLDKRGVTKNEQECTGIGFVLVT